MFYFHISYSICYFIKEHFLEQYFTLSQFNFHFLRQTKGLLQTGHILDGKFCFFNLVCI